MSEQTPNRVRIIAQNIVHRICESDGKGVSLMTHEEMADRAEAVLREVGMTDEMFMVKNRKDQQ